MSYGQSEAKIQLFSTCQASLDELVSEIKATLDKKGAEYSGPAAHPTVDPDKLRFYLYHVKYPEADAEFNNVNYEHWLSDVLEDEENLKAMLQAAEEGDALCARSFRVYGEKVIRETLESLSSDKVHATVELGHRSHQKQESSPYGWDPDLDNIPSHPDGW